MFLWLWKSISCKMWDGNKAKAILEAQRCKGSKKSGRGRGKGTANKTGNGAKPAFRQIPHGRNVVKILRHGGTQSSWDLYLCNPKEKPRINEPEVPEYVWSSGGIDLNSKCSKSYLNARNRSWICKSVINKKRLIHWRELRNIRVACCMPELVSFLYVNAA